MESSVVFVFLIAIIVGVGLEMLFQWELLILFALGIFFYLYIKEGKRNKEKCKKLIIYWYRIYHYRRVTYNHV